MTSLRFAAQADRPVLDNDLDILLVESGQLGGDADFLVGLAELHIGSSEAAREAAKQRLSEVTEDIIE